MSGGEVRRVLREDIQLVQNLIEWCLMSYMNQKEVVELILHEAKIDPRFTKLVWQKLEEDNPEFFEAYRVRLVAKQQIRLFNDLMKQQVDVMNSGQFSVGLPPPLSNGSSIGTYGAPPPPSNGSSNGTYGGARPPLSNGSSNGTYGGARPPLSNGSSNGTNGGAPPPLSNGTDGGAPPPLSNGSSNGTYGGAPPPLSNGSSNGTYGGAPPPHSNCTSNDSSFCSCSSCVYNSYR